jgi:hypothetical protein
MTRRDISINHLRRRMGKVLFFILDLVIGITTVVTLISCLKDGSYRCAESAMKSKKHRAKGVEFIKK